MILSKSLSENSGDNLICLNSFNILDYLIKINIITEFEYIKYFVNINEISLIKPLIDDENLSFNLNALCLLLHSDVINDIECKKFSRSTFLSIFRHIIGSVIDHGSANQFLFKIFSFVYNKMKIKLPINFIREIINSYLLIHPVYTNQHFYTEWFVFCCSLVPPKINNLILKSEIHSYFYETYSELMLEADSKNDNSHILIKNIVNHISLLPEDLFSTAHARVKSCFIPDSNEYELFESSYQEMSINKKLNP